MPGRAFSLRFRLLAATVGALALALVLAGVLLGGLFREHVMRQQMQALTTQLDQLTARLEFDAAGRPLIDPTALSDPRWQRPLGGLYWQVDAVVAGPSASAPQRGVLRSRSLWDGVLAAPADHPADGELHVHELPGPDGAPLLLVERAVQRAAAGSPAWRLMVAGELRETQAAVARFHGVLAVSLLALGLLLCAAAWAQVAIGLAPLRVLQAGLADVLAGRQPRLHGRHPAEVQPLVDHFNAVLDRNAEVVARARTQAGNLAHAIKTPLAVLSQAAAAAPDAPWAPLVAEQVSVARRQVDWHLARARAAAAQGLPGAHVLLQPAVDGLLRVMGRVHASRELQLKAVAVPADAAFAGEVEDLQEMLGNLLDNACQWARHSVQVGVEVVPAEPGSAAHSRHRLRITIDDDGPGIAPERRATVLARGARLDESVPGSGLGLAIVDELVGLYGGRLQLSQSPSGGLRAVVELPAA
ncbi:sensor histidine kinase [Rubrivivax rivuli]|uniref:histidine kinase n=1 Tax=Rubrivivax rivuli TaxID=1862385 RepID=A0A437RE31_9BURK|nr:ATP-binding protein [Rubrivivax rivuli]RVU45008.1 ATP-binding protein [Rubrivivax rivuli]